MALTPCVVAHRGIHFPGFDDLGGSGSPPKQRSRHHPSPSPPSPVTEVTHHSNKNDIKHPLQIARHSRRRPT